jgi:hypothetical protein
MTEKSTVAIPYWDKRLLFESTSYPKEFQAGGAGSTQPEAKFACLLALKHGAAEDSVPICQLYDFSFVV